MKKGIYIIFILLSSCDSGYFCYVKNNREDAIYIKTIPPLEDFFSTEFKKKYLEIKFYTEDSIPMYKLNSKDSIKIYGSVGRSPKTGSWPINYIQIYTVKDTITIKNKLEIIEYLRKNKVKGESLYCINIY